jgi:hypothetical protein
MPETITAPAATTVKAGDTKVEDGTKPVGDVKPAAEKAVAPTETTAESLGDNAVSAIEAWNGNPSDDALRDAARVAITKAKEFTASAKTKAAEDAKKTAELEAKNKAPEKYELKLPEKSLLNPTQVEEIKAFAKANNLSNEKAQAFVDHQNSLLANFVSYNNPGGEGWNKQLDSWEAESLADPEIGGGNKETLAKNAELSKRVIAKYGGKEISDFLHASGYGSNKSVLRFLGKIAKAMGEDTLVLPGAGPTTKKSIEDVFYGGGENKTQT